MRNLYFLVFYVLISNTLFSQENTFRDKNVSDSIVLNQSSDSLEYDVVIIDAGFESWLVSHAKPKTFYSQSYYENWNRQYVAEWNSRYSQGNFAHIIESRIEYDYTIDYGLDVNYQLYNYFLFFEQKNNISLIRRKGN